MPTLLNREIGPIGFGLMGFTWRPIETPDTLAFPTMRTALSRGSNFWNTGEFYGNAPSMSQNLSLLNRYFSQYPEDAEKVILSVKGGMDITSFTPRGDREGVRNSVENCLRILDGKKKIDIFECARVDKKVPIEETMEALKELVVEGKIGGIGLSEVGPETIRRAAKVVKIAAVEVEVSLWSMHVFKKGGVADTCRELGIPVVAYSPLGMGFLTGRWKTPADIPEGDRRKGYDRFSEENWEANLRIVEKVRMVAEGKGCSLAQVCIAWVRQRGNKEGAPVIIPLPGATTVERVKENYTLVELTEEEMRELDEMAEKAEVKGGRYNARGAANLEG
ncbi:NADP-dependent oxidoreductase domain-containing protein [Pyronema omphalodes]|nr:NADP-dependent oxidoreductase domain-containing protein [Pyronema omphalodes]